MCLDILAALAIGEHHLHLLAYLPEVLLPGDLANQVDQAVVAFLDDCLWAPNASIVAAGVPGRNRVLEGESCGKPRCFDHAESGLEIRFGLSGEADDDVRGDSSLWHSGSDFVDDAQISPAAVGAPHRTQDPCRSGLQRHVQLGHHIRRLSHRRDDVVCEVFWMGRGEANRSSPSISPQARSSLAKA